MSMLHFDVDLSQFETLIKDLQASNTQIRFAMYAALGRTATTLRTMSARGLRDELQLRTVSLLRKRLKKIRLRLKSGPDDVGIQLWYGLNDMPASWFKGRAKKTATGAEKRGQNIEGGFVSKSEFKGRETIFKRRGKRRLPIVEQNLEVQDAGIVFIEDEIFDKTEEVFWKYFERELKARVKYKIGAA
jgi:hypothetical protein